MSKILTVSVAAYNVEKYIAEALENFLDESVIDELEIFVIDDGGTDSTLEIAKKYESMFPNTFKLVHKENGGWGSTVNYGIQHATGKYFKQLDGDDFFLKDSLPDFIQLLKNTECDFVYTSYTIFEDGSNRIIEKKEVPSDYELMKEYEISELQQNLSLNMHSCTFKTSILKGNVNILEKCFYTDVEYMLKAIANVQSVIFSDIEVYQYRIGRAGQSMSLEGYRKHYQEHEKVIITLLDYYKNAKLKEQVRRIFQQRISEMINNQYLMYLYVVPSKQHKKELISFEKLLKKRYPDFYKTSVKKICILRKTHYWGYRVLVKDTIKKLEV